MILEIAVFRITWKWNHITDILHSCNKKNQTFKPETETGVRHGAELACVHIPGHVYLTDLREKDIHASHGFAVFIEFHVERLDFLGIIGKHDRTFEMLLHKITLMLGSKIRTPVNREFEFLTAFLKDFHTLCIRKTYKVILDNKFQTVDQLFVEMVVEELNVILAVAKPIVAAILDKFSPS